MMLEFRRAAATNNVLDMIKLSNDMGNDFNINEPGPQSGKTATHVAAERSHFQTLYWLFERGANFYCTDNAGKTAIDYLQEKEFTFIGSELPLKGDRQYYLCNAHYKIWLAHDREIFMPYLYQHDFKQYREKNPDGYISLVYSTTLLSNTALSDLVAFAEKYQVALISFEEELFKLTSQYGTEEDKQCYQLALNELNQYSNQRGGNLAVIADLIRWSSVLLRKGSYEDTDVEIGQHKWTRSINTDKSLALNLGSLVYPHMTTPWLNGDIIAAASLFPQPLCQGDFRITLSKTACFIIKKVQLSLLSSCKDKMNKRIETQQFLTTTLSDFSIYLKDYFKACGSAPFLTTNFLPNEINKIKEKGLELFSSEERASIIKRVANLMKERVAQEYGSFENAQKYSRVFQNIKIDEHEKFLMNYMQALHMSNIKEGVKQLCGAPVFSPSIWECIENDDWKKYSIYSDEEVQSAFRSTNTVKFDTNHAENERANKTQKFADLSFTPFGMASVLERSQALKEKLEKS